MTKIELAAAKRLFNAIDRLALTPYELSVNPTPSPAIAKKRARFSELDSQVAALAEAVVFREIGLKKNMVIHAVNDVGLEKRLHVDQITLFDSGLQQDPSLEWDFAGNKLKQDGSSTMQRDCCLISGHGAIMSRRQDGSWKKLERNNGRSALRTQ